MLDLSDMRDLEIDAERRTAWAETGLTAGEYTAAAGEHGLATGFGDAGSVGLGGITLSGGVGFLVRKHGLTIDDLLAAEVVTADGELLRVDADNHPDLFWAIRGGGGNFGVATRLQFRLHEVGHDRRRDAVPPRDARGGRRLRRRGGGRAGGAVGDRQRHARAADAVPAARAARPAVVMAMLVYAGDVDAGERAVAPFRALAEPVADMVRRCATRRCIRPAEPELPPGRGRPHVVRRQRRPSRRGDDPRRGSRPRPRPMAVVQLRVLGGAMARVPADATAFAHRDARASSANVVAMYGSPEERPVHEAWVAELARELQRRRPRRLRGFLGDEGEERVRAAYPGATWERLAAVKAAYDPDNVFRLNQNIPPAVD